MSGGRGIEAALDTYLRMTAAATERFQRQMDEATTLLAEVSEKPAAAETSDNAVAADEDGAAQGRRIAEPGAGPGPRGRARGGARIFD